MEEDTNALATARAERSMSAPASQSGSSEKHHASQICRCLRSRSGQAHCGRWGQESHLADVYVVIAERGILHCEHVDDGGIGLQAFFQDPAVLPEFGVRSLKSLERVCGAQVGGSPGFLLGGLGLEEILDVWVLVSQVPASDVRFDGELGDVESPVRAMGVPARRRFIAAMIARRMGSVS